MKATQNDSKSDRTCRFLLFFIFAMLCPVFCEAQYYFSTTHRDYYKYNDLTEDFDKVSGYDENSMFKINENLTMFEHITPNMTSTYYVTNSSFDEDDGQLSLNVTSDVGNEYLYIFDINDNEIRVLFLDGSNQILVFQVKKFWTKE